MLKENHLFSSSFVIVILLAFSSIQAQKNSPVSPTVSIQSKNVLTLRSRLRSPESAVHQKDLPEKIARTERLLAAAPDDEVLLNTMAILYFHSERYANALKMLERAVELNPRSELYLNLSIIYDRLERFPESLAAVRRSLELNPENIRARNQLCELYLITKDFKTSSSCYRSLTETNPGNPAFFVRYGISLIHEGRLKQSIKILETAAGTFDNDPNVRNALGLALYKKGKNKKAVVIFNEILARHPRFTQARFNLAIVQLSMRKRSAALKNYFVLKNAGHPLAAKLYKSIYGDMILSVDDYRR